MKTDLKSLLADANANVTSISCEEVQTKLNDNNYVLIDVREKLEFDNDGAIPGAVNIPRGMLEFMMDKSTPYYNTIFETGKTLFSTAKAEADQYWPHIEL